MAHKMAHKPKATPANATLQHKLLGLALEAEARCAEKGVRVEVDAIRHDSSKSVQQALAKLERRALVTVDAGKRSKAISYALTATGRTHAFDLRNGWAHGAREPKTHRNVASTRTARTELHHLLENDRAFDERLGEALGGSFVMGANDIPEDATDAEVLREAAMRWYSLALLTKVHKALKKNPPPDAAEFGPGKGVVTITPHDIDFS